MRGQNELLRLLIRSVGHFQNTAGSDGLLRRVKRARSRELPRRRPVERTLLDAVAHNVRTPLAAIIGALNTLDANGDRLDAATRQELIEVARAGAERLNRLITNLLDMSRVEAGVLCAHLDPCDLRDVAGAALEQLGVAAAGRVIQTAIQPDIAFVELDFVLIVQVLVNLLDNAIKYSPPGTPIVLEVRAEEEGVRFSVSDDGPGVPEPHLTRIFDKYERAGRSGETGGVGLGLSIAKAIVEAHNGSIWAARRTPRGFAVHFALPIRRRLAA